MNQIDLPFSDQLLDLQGSFEEARGEGDDPGHVLVDRPYDTYVELDALDAISLERVAQFPFVREIGREHDDGLDPMFGQTPDQLEQCCVCPVQVVSAMNEKYLHRTSIRPKSTLISIARIWLSWQESLEDIPRFSICAVWIQSRY